LLEEDKNRKVYLTTEISTGNKYTLTLVKVPSLPLNECKAELDIFYETNPAPHKNIVEYKHIFFNRNEKEFGVIAEYCPGNFLLHEYRWKSCNTYREL
jgi:hypothetical protein